MAAARYDVIIVGAGPAGAACGKRCVDAGAKTLIVDKKQLPRHKNCSGLISHEALDFVRNNFGPIPEKAKSTSGDYQGIALHFPHAPSLYIDAITPVPNVWRKEFDFFLVQGSGAEVEDGFTIDGIQSEKNQVILRGHKGKRRKTLRASYVLGADGGTSSFVQHLAPEIYNGIPWGIAYQRYYTGNIELEKGYFHSFFYTGMGIYTWLTFKDDYMLIGTAIIKGEKPDRYYSNLMVMLKRRFNLRHAEKPELVQGCLSNAMAPLHRFFLGKGRVLVAGEAAGFMHMGGEGISAALYSGSTAGDCMINALSGEIRGDLVGAYRRAIGPEIEKTQDQWNILRMERSSTLKFRQIPSLHEAPLSNIKRMYDLIRFLNQKGHGSGIGTAVLRNTFIRAYRGRYNEI